MYKFIVFFLLSMPIFSNAEENQAQYREFTASSGETLKAVLTRWASESQYVLVWSVSNENGELDWKIVHPLTINGDIYEAVGIILESYDYDFSWRFYGNGILRVSGDIIK